MLCRRCPPGWTWLHGSSRATAAIGASACEAPDRQGELTAYLSADYFKLSQFAQSAAENFLLKHAHSAEPDRLHALGSLQKLLLKSIIDCSFTQPAKLKLMVPLLDTKVKSLANCTIQYHGFHSLQKVCKSVLHSAFPSCMPGPVGP